MEVQVALPMKSLALPEQFRFDNLVNPYQGTPEFSEFKRLRRTVSFVLADSGDTRSR